MNKITHTLFLMIISMSAIAGSSLIIPADKEKIFRQVGESVFVQCKKQSSYSSNCEVDCGNGRRYRKAKGYCHYLTAGEFILNVSTRHRNKYYVHTAVVSISNKMKTVSQQVSRKRAVGNQPGLEPLPVVSHKENINLQKNKVATVSMEQKKAETGTVKLDGSGKDIFSEAAFTVNNMRQNKLNTNRIESDLSDVSTETNQSFDTLLNAEDRVGQENFGQLNSQLGNQLSNQINNDFSQSALPSDSVFPGSDQNNLSNNTPNINLNVNSQNQFVER